MPDTSIIIAIAKLDGWELSQAGTYMFRYEERHGRQVLVEEAQVNAEKLQRYLTSRDAIIPVIEKVCQDQAIKVKFLNQLRDLLAFAVDMTGEKISDYNLIVALARQLCIALLKATGGYKE